MSVLFPPLSGDPPPMSIELPPERQVGALWRRLIAAFIDVLIVGFAGMLITLPFFDALSRLGAWGRLVGFCMALLYFGVLNSEIGDGQTLGKRFLSLQVVNASGEPISFSRSVARYTILVAPFFLNYLRIPTSRTPQSLMYVLGIVIFGIGTITVYLVLFNGRTRQGLHDLTVGSFVAEADILGALKPQAVWKGHLAILAVLFLSGMIGGKIFTTKVMTMADFPVMFEDVRLIEDIDHVQAAGVSDLTWTSYSSNEKKRIFVVTVFWSGGKDEEEAVAARVASLLLDHDQNVRSRDQLQINIVRGYDLGIAHAQVNRRFEDTPANWWSKVKSSQ